MEKDFWHNKWENRDIAFHGNEANPLLTNNIDKLALKEGSKIFIPLCGKTLDIAWLLSKGYKVAGCELIETAVKELFDELNVKPQISDLGSVKHYSYENIDIFVGDIFNLDKSILGSISAVYDRAALVALPYETRKKYSQHLIDITQNATQLLVVYEYDQEKVDGPPFSVINEEIVNHYDKSYKINFIEKVEVIGGLKGKCPAIENVWILNT